MADSLWADVKHRDIEFVFSKQVEICNDQNEFTFLVNIGEVDIEDGYVGFEIAFKYDTNFVMVYPMPIVAGTISSRLKYDANYVRGTVRPIENTSLSQVRAEVSHVGGPVSGPQGNETLVMFTGKYVGPDTCGLFDYIYFDEEEGDYLYFFNYLGNESIQDQELKYVYSPAEIETNTYAKYARVITDFDSITLDSAKTISNTVSMVKNEQMKDVMMTVSSTNASIFDFQIIESDDDNFMISNVDYENENGNRIAKVYATILGEVNQLECFDIKYKLENTQTDSCSFNIQIENLDECKCIADYISEEKKIKNVIPEVSCICDLSDEYIRYTDNEIIIASDNMITKAYLYNLNGEMIESLQPNKNKIILVKANYLNGAYSLILENSIGSKLSKKILINK